MSDYPQEMIDTLRNMIAAQNVKAIEDRNKIINLNTQLGKAIGAFKGLLWLDSIKDIKDAIYRVLRELGEEE